MIKRRAIVIIFFLLTVVLLCVAVFSSTLLAASNIALSGGINISYRPEEDDGSYTKEEIDSMAEETTEMLNSGGFKTDGDGVLKSNTDNIYNQKADAIKMHEVLMGRIDKDGNPCNRTPMVRYMRYENGSSACESVSGLIVILDLSRTNIVAFDSGWINLMGYVLVGASDDVWAGSTADITYPYEEECTVYNAASGEAVGTEKITLPTDFLANEWSSYPEYSLRIILPAYATIDDDPNNQVSFNTGSLLFNMPDMTPSAVELDVTQLKMTAVGLDVSGLYIAADAGGWNSLPHMHVITKHGQSDEAQAQYGLSAMLDLTFENTYQGSGEWEFALYMRPYSDSDYARLYMKASYNRYAYPADTMRTAVLYSAPGQECGSAEANIGVLNMFGFLKKLSDDGRTYISGITFKHALRDEAGVIKDGENTALTADFNTGGVSCDHNGGTVIGNFNEIG